MSSGPSRSESLAKAALGATVFAATVYAGVIALSAEVPEKLPAPALQSPDLYRVEIGVGCLVGFYFAILIVTLALRGTGLVKFGKDGAEVGEVIEQVDAQEDAVKNLTDTMHREQEIRESTANGLEAVRQALTEKASEYERRLKALERSQHHRDGSSSEPPSSESR
jgi:hypothetical protein